MKRSEWILGSVVWLIAGWNVWCYGWLVGLTDARPVPEVLWALI